MITEFARRTILLPCILNLAGTAALAPTTVRAAPTRTTSARDQAVVHFQEGNEAFRRGDTHEAYRQYRIAWELHRTFDIACNLGRAEAELGKLTQAADHLAYCLDNFSSSPQQDLQSARQRYSELFRTIRTQVASLRFDVDPDGARVFVNGVDVGTTPLDRDIFVLPGTQVVELKLENHHALRREIPASAGESRSLQLRLARLEAADPAAGSGPVVHEDAASARSTEVVSDQVSTRSLALVSGAVLTAAGAGVGLGFYLQGAKLDDEASVLREGIETDGASDPNPCATGSHTACAQLDDTVDRRNRAWTISTVGFVSMGAFGLGTLAAWLWWPADSSTSAQSPVIAPVVTSHQLGAVLSGTL
ncbi:MAG TPA: PEGA domain-containing protein [Polyangiaceae bacterium]|nr:PEGA domain-containing protein [Polyangiaceae bacterium]